MTRSCRILVRLWPLAVSDAGLSFLHALLTPDEQDRAAKLRIPSVARSFVAARGMLRKLLAEDCRCQATSIVFSTSASGKPTVVSPAGGPAFSLSHSGGYGALATVAGFSPQTAGPIRLGVDIEEIRPVEQDIARSYFTPREAAWLQGLGALERQRGFTELWVLKEAYLKATGEGLQGGLESLEVDVTTMQPGATMPTGATTQDGRHVAPLAVRGSRETARRWQLANFAVSEQIRGGVAVEGPCMPPCMPITLQLTWVEADNPTTGQ